eukprot:TRINITY_DN1118_c0_g1_i1.p1 TRINITY_DN1118_c0_g1~~TRINITY_DN1118_c0_g1_i1.p1  ORF type:complete len:147 (-),score=8.26 TRINITY_DN1118_c0_g1_i1:157-597(-)
MLQRSFLYVRRIVASKPKRIVSPDVAIYKFPLPAVTSILNRITGTVLTLGLFAISGPVLYDPASISNIVTWIHQNEVLLVLTKLSLSYAFIYHTVAGLRHFWWDFGNTGLNSIEEMDRSSRFVFFVPILLAIICAFVKISGREDEK